LQAQRRKVWPTVSATIERRPASKPWRCLGGDLLYQRGTSEHWAKYTFGGRPYEARLEDKAYIVVGPFLVWRTARPQGPTTLHVNPADPRRVSTLGDSASWPWIVGVGAAIALLGLALSAN
jgi:hypothetical protein